jgi:molybdenum cofactor biosynthesis protein B
MLSRAVAGVAQGKPLFSLPGSIGAVRLGMLRLILPEIGHLLRELRR